MTTTPSEAAGDYGYDLVHEDVRANRAPDQRPEAVHDPLPERRIDPRGNVVSGDWSYDQAHGS
jgi:hypothetical protein